MNDPLSQSKPSILLVDDTEANLIATEALLGDLSCEIVSAPSGNEALRHLLKREFALILLDVQMPEMDGYEVARLSRDNPSTRDVPIIFVTAATESVDNELRGYGTGAVDYLAKPVNPYVLRSKVQVFLDLYQSRKRLSNEVKAHQRTLAILQHSNAALRHFTHAASHDLAAPLRAIAGFLDALEEEAGDALNQSARGFLTRARNGSLRMRALLDSLLVFAGLQKEVELEDVDCMVLVEQVRGDLADRFAASNATLEVSDLPKVRGDAGRLYQLFLNLIGNAIKFQRPGEHHHVRVYAEQKGNQKVFCVEDNGIGVAEPHHERIFEAFQRLHDQGTYGGTGLGLAICRLIVEQHRGKIWVESEPDKGARFYFTLR